MHSRIFKLQHKLDEEYENINELDFEENGFLDSYHGYETETYFLLDLWRCYLKDKKMLTLRLEGALDYHS